MAQRAYRSLQALLMLVLCIFLIEKFASGRLSWYINPRFQILTALGILLLGAMAQVIFSELRRSKSGSAKKDDHHLHDHDHVHAETLPWGNLWFVVLPLVVGILVPARPLDASSVGTRGLTTTAPLVSSDSAAKLFETASEERTILDWLRIFGSQSDLSSFIGQPASAVGFVFSDEKLTSAQFYLGRYVVSCCAADGVAIAMVVNWPEAASLQEDTWVLVKGPVALFTLDGSPVPMIEATSVEIVEEPEQPYLYP